jgi:acyl dehydratase
MGDASATTFGAAGASRLVDAVSVGEELPALGYDVTATTIVLGALAARDWRPMHHDHDFAVNRNGTQDIFMNTPNQAAWFERFVTDWTGPAGRLGKMTFRMKGSVFPGDHMVLAGTVTDVSVDQAGCGWVGLDVALSVDGDVKTTCAVRVALPTSADDNLWTRRGDRWIPDPDRRP